MNRRQFLAAAGAGGALALAGARPADHDGCDGRTFATPADARHSPRETLAYVIGTYAGTGLTRPDYLATVDLDSLFCFFF